MNTIFLKMVIDKVIIENSIKVGNVSDPGAESSFYEPTEGWRWNNDT